MPQHKSCAKRIKTSEKARVRNRAVRSRVRLAVKALDAATDETRTEVLNAAHSELDRAAKKRVMPKRRADRKKSRLARAANRLSAASA